jgi:hypothetical protein
LLTGSQWDVAAAVKSFRFLQCSARPPSGPQKNGPVAVTLPSSVQGITVGSGPGKDSLKPETAAEVKHRVSDKPPGSPNAQSKFRCSLYCGDSF